MRTLLLILLFCMPLKVNGFWGTKNCFAESLDEGTTVQTTRIASHLIAPYMPGNGMIYAFAEERASNLLTYTYLYAFDEITGSVLWWTYVDNTGAVKQNTPLHLHKTALYCFTQNHIYVIDNNTGDIRRNIPKEAIPDNDRDDFRHVVFTNNGEHPCFVRTYYGFYRLNPLAKTWKRGGARLSRNNNAFITNGTYVLFYDPYYQKDTHILWPEKDESRQKSFYISTNHQFSFLTTSYLIFNDIRDVYEEERTVPKNHLYFFHFEEDKIALEHPHADLLKILYAEERDHYIDLYVHSVDGKNQPKFEKWRFCKTTKKIDQTETLSTDLTSPHAFIYCESQKRIFGCCEKYPFIYDLETHTFFRDFEAGEMGYGYADIKPLDIYPVGLKEDGSPVTHLRK